MEKVLHRLVVCHFFRVLRYFLFRHGAPMKSAGFDLCELIERFGSEDKCREYLEALRWPPLHPHCPKCLSDKISRIYEA